jgi:hypothetical protein
LQSRDALIAVDHQVTLRVVRHGHHHNRHLLTHGGQRGQQATLPLRLARPQMLPAPIQLVKLQLHR